MLRKVPRKAGGRIPFIRSQSDPIVPPIAGCLSPSLWVVGFLNYADRQAIFSVFPLLQSRLHLNLAELGLLGSSFAWAYGLAAPFAGYAVDRMRRKTAIIGGLEFWSWICAATALTSRLWSLAVLRCVMGLGRKPLLSCSALHDERLSRATHAFPRARPSPNQRLRGHHHGWFFRGLACRTLRLALAILVLRRGRGVVRNPAHPPC